jgi:hypothetical protein
LVGGLCIVVAALSVLRSQETFGKNLDYVET